MKNQQFRSVPVKSPGSSAFDLSHEKKLSFQLGQLIPIFLQHVLPSDKLRVSSELIVRFAPLLAPLMHRIDVYVHYFFVPYRLVWEDWEDFITGGIDGLSTPVMPHTVYSNSTKALFDKGRVMDYLGIPPTAATITQDIDLSLLPLRSYLKIYNDYYMDQQLDTERAYSVVSGHHSTDHGNNSYCLNRNLEHDYFTSCLPTAQRGNAVEIDLDIIGDTEEAINLRVYPGGAVPAAGDVQMVSSALQSSTSEALMFREGIGQGLGAVLEITELRRAARLQEFLEKTNIGGGRYNEVMLMHFGQRSSDQRLQRAEYLGGGKSPVQISEVLQTSQADTTPQGTMAGKGISIGKTNRFTKMFEEHGIVLGIMSALPRTAYQEGIDREWRKTDRTEYFWPSFAQLGEQEVLQSEVYWDPTGTDMDDTFGYQSRYAEYKFQKSSVHGDFIDDFDYWHMGRILASAPTLNSAFIECESTDYDRVFAVTTGSVHKLYAQIYNDVQAVRPIPTYNTPVL